MKQIAITLCQFFGCDNDFKCFSLYLRLNTISKEFTEFTITLDIFTHNIAKKVCW